jgi:hypothetical protein
MATSQASVRVTISDSEYVEALGEKFAELAVIRTGELALFKPVRRTTHLSFQFVAVTHDSLCFFIEINSYSTRRSKVESALTRALEVEVSAEQVRIACQSPTPVVMILSDADREHVRYLRLDALQKPADEAETVLLSFPVENTITGESVRALVAELAKERAVSVVS